MIQIVVNIIFLLALAAIVIPNIGSESNIPVLNLLGYEFRNVSVVVAAFLSFILGMLYAFTQLLYRRLRKQFGGKPAKKSKKEKKAAGDFTPGEESPVPPVMPGF
ncbi:MAG: hypothetical protein LBC67_07770 [Spirochaetales bacterium]|jgi:uncharacterized integral membrane protein|nr:hypothetical protein [Spirochaetales bacterium]